MTHVCARCVAINFVFLRSAPESFQSVFFFKHVRTTTKTLGMYVIYKLLFLFFFYIKLNKKLVFKKLIVLIALTNNVL